MQRKKDERPAQGPTADEVRDRFGQLWEELEKKKDKQEYKSVMDITGGWHLSYDNDSIHTSANLPSLGIRPFKCPAYSPDIHSAAEHAVARTWLKFKKDKRSLPTSPSMETYKTTLEEAFKKANPQDTVYNDVMRLPMVYKVINTPKDQAVGKYQGSGGDWPHPRLYH